MRFTRDSLLRSILSGRVQKSLLLSSNFEQSIKSEFDMWAGECFPAWGLYSKLHPVGCDLPFGDGSIIVRTSSNSGSPTLWHASILYFSNSQEGLNPETGIWDTLTELTE